MERARRLQKTKEYYFSRKLEEIRRMSETGTPVINLGIGNPDLPPPEKVIRKLLEIAVMPDVHGYQSYRGLPALRKAYANWYGNFYNVSLDPDHEVIPLVGSKEGVFYLSMAFLNPGDKALVPNVGYPAYRSVTEMVEAIPVTYNISEKTGWYPDFRELEQLDLTGVKLMWINYPNMPSGKPANRELFRRLVDFGMDHDILICHDNPYSFILNDRPLSILSVHEARKTAIELNSMSKTYNMAGWRMGMLAGAPEFLDPVFTVLSNVESGIFKPLQLATVEAIQAPTEWFGALNKEYIKRRERVFALFDALGCTYETESNGLFVWAKTPGGVDAYDFTDRILYDARVFVTPGGIFGNNGKSFVRVSLCEEVPVLQEALERIENII